MLWLTFLIASSTSLMTWSIYQYEVTYANDFMIQQMSGDMMRDEN